ncbi:septal ring lytic transglycosylase RlpA family protein [Leptolyngbya sp. PL-A3]|nr:septal ring lytic transglycosylase RlpA family protein [Leptolyngbya sp. FACHB-8]
MPDPACLSRSASQSFEESAGLLPLASSLLPERSAAAPPEVAIPSLNNPLRQLYGRLTPWVRGDRPASVMNEQVRLILADQSSAETRSLPSAPLFHVCEAKGTEQTLAESFKVQAPYQIWIQNHLVMALSEQTAAEAMVQRLRLLIETPGFDANGLVPQWVGDDPAITAGNQVLLKIDPLMERAFHHNADLIAIDWTNNLRRALGAEPLSLVDAQAQMYGLVESRQGLQGTASWYGPYFHKRLTANGERFNQYALTVAHKTLQFNTFLKVTNRKNGQSVIVRVNDRGPYVGERSLDLSYQAARCINSDEVGVVSYEAMILAPGIPDAVQLARPAKPNVEFPRQIAGNPMSFDRPPID